MEGAPDRTNLSAVNGPPKARRIQAKEIGILITMIIKIGTFKDKKGAWTKGYKHMPYYALHTLTRPLLV